MHTEEIGLLGYFNIFMLFQGAFMPIISSMFIAELYPIPIIQHSSLHKKVVSKEALMYV